MAIVHCRYESHQHFDDSPDMTDGWVWICYGPIGPEAMPGEDLDGYHNAIPPCPCFCGFTPAPEEAEVQP